MMGRVKPHRSKRNRIKGQSFFTCMSRWLVEWIGMRRARLLAPKGGAVAYYHCISRAVDKRSIFGDTEKADFVTLMRLYEKLCGVRVLTYCLMSNHFHMLVAVPERPADELLPSEADLIELIRSTLGKARADALLADWTLWREISPSSAEGRIERAKQEWFARMWNISAFMKTIKQRFTQWFNARHGRKGTLWEERFKSVLVQRGEALATVAAYIDLNPVRAGLVKDPKDYRWCGYGAACGGVMLARRGLEEVIRESVSRETYEIETARSKSRPMALYRRRLLIWGTARGQAANGLALKPGMSPRAAQRELDRADGELSAATMLHCRVRYFTQGVAIGSREYVEGIFGHYRDRFSATRRDGARRVRAGGERTGLFALRELRG
jgi:putative transposase